MTDPRHRHSRQHGIYPVGGAAGQHRRRHQLLDLEAEHGGAISGHRVNEIPLREDAERLYPTILHDQCADSMLAILRTASSTLSAG